MADPMIPTRTGGVQQSLQQAPTVEAPDAWELYRAKRLREEQTSSQDYVGAMWRQDSFVDGLVAQTVGNQYAPDPTYSPFAKTEWDRLTTGIQPEFHQYFNSATSQPQAEFIRERLLQKQDDLARLGDLGFAGNAGRLLFGFVDPVNLAAGISSGGVASAALGVSRATRSLQAARTAAQAEQAAAGVAGAARFAASPTAVTAGLVSAAAQNAAYEKIRQNVNFEDNTASVVEAAVFGTMFAAPFVAWNSRVMNNLARAADLDARSIHVARKMDAGEALNERDIATIKEVQVANGLIAEVETGRRAPETIYVDSKGVATKQSDRVLYVDSAGRVSTALPEDTTGKLGFFSEELRLKLRDEMKAILDVEAPNRNQPPVEPAKPRDPIAQAAREAAEDKRFAAQRRALTKVLTEAGGTSTRGRLPRAERDKMRALVPELESLILDNLDNQVPVVRGVQRGDYERALAQVAAKKQAELDELAAAGKITPIEREQMADGVERDVRALRAEVARETARELGESLSMVHGTTPENAAAIRASGRFHPDAGKRVYPYSEFGPHASYFTQRGGWWLDPEAVKTARAVEYKDSVEATMRADTNVVTIRTEADLDKLAREVGYKDGKDLMDALFVDGLDESPRPDFSRADEATRRLREAGVDAIIIDHKYDGQHAAPDQIVVFNHDKIDVDGFTPAEKADGQEVFWKAEDGGMDGGVVVGTTPSGKLKIDLYPDFPPGAKLPSGSARFKFMHRSELDEDSPLYADETPEGFLPGSVGSAQVAAIPRDPVSPEFDNPTSRAQWRFDIFARLNKSANPHVQELGHLLVKDAIGNSKEWAQAMSASERKKLLQRTIGGRFHWEAREAFNELRRELNIGLVDAYRGHQQFYEDVTRLARGDREVLSGYPAEAHKHLERAAGEQRRVYDEMVDVLVKAGVQGAEGLKADGAYVNRVWNHNNIREAMKTHGDEAVLGLLADSIRTPSIAKLAPEERLAKAKKFLSAVMKLEYDHRLQDIQLSARDMITLRKELEGIVDKQGTKVLSPSEIDSVIETMFDVRVNEPDAGNAGNLKFRLDIDENARATTKAGELRLSDLFENDSRILVDRYMNSMAGHAALAERGFKSQADVRAKIEEAKKWHDENGAMSADAKALLDELQIIEDMNAYIIGRPMSVNQFNAIDRIAGAFRAYARSTFLGQLGVAAAFELKNAIGLAGWGALMDLSSFRGIINALRSGKRMDSELQADFNAMFGFAHDRAAAYARQNEVTDFTYDRGLTRFENFANKASHAVDIISGNNYITSATRNLSTHLMVQKLFRMADGRTKMTDSIRERLVHNGIDRNMIDDVLTDLRAFTVANDGKVLEIKWEDWQQQRPKSYGQFQTAITREVRDAIQDHDIGETGMWMHTTLGKFVSELRTFNLAAHAKQFLKGLHYLDRTTLMTWTMAFAGECIAYTLQTSINFAHNPAELEKRLDPDKIWRSAVARMSVLGITSFVLDAGWYAATGSPFLPKGGGTANTDTRNVLQTPSVMLASRLVGSAVGTASALNPLSTDVLTKQNVRDIGGILPGGNTWLMRNILDGISSEFPRRETSAR